MENRRKRKLYSELTFTDDFMFCKILSSNLKLCKEVLELLLGVNIHAVELSEAQKEIKNIYDGKGIRLDVYVEDDENTVYDLEMQCVVSADLPKRMRYYQGMIDNRLIGEGKSYRELKRSIIIFICLKDPFGEGLPIYIFSNRCQEKPELELGDEATKVIVNASARVEDTSPDLVAFFEFLMDNKIGSSLTESIQQEIDLAKYMNKWEDEYMTLQMKLQEEREEGRIEGREEGREEGQDTIIDVVLKLKSGMTEEALLAEGYDRHVIDKAKVIL